MIYWGTLGTPWLRVPHFCLYPTCINDPNHGWQTDPLLGWAWGGPTMVQFIVRLNFGPTHPTCRHGPPNQAAPSQGTSCSQMISISQDSRCHEELMRTEDERCLRWNKNGVIKSLQLYLGFNLPSYHFFVWLLVFLCANFGGKLHGCLVRQQLRGWGVGHAEWMITDSLLNQLTFPNINEWMQD